MTNHDPENENPIRDADDDFGFPVARSRTDATSADLSACVAAYAAERAGVVFGR